MDIKYRERLQTVVTTLLLFLMIQGGITEGNDACYGRNRESDLESCLQGIRQVAEDDSLFWFGSVARGKCSSPRLAYSINCYNPHRTAVTLSELTFGVKNTDLSTLDSYIDVQFTSEPGNYSGCDYEFTTNKTEIFSIDPLSMKAYEPWHLRTKPSISWTASFSPHLYTLVIIDVGYGWTHGIFMNIPGKDFTMGDVVKDYHGPRNARDVSNPYAFVLYRQASRIDVTSVFLPFMDFNLTAFAELHSLQGPVGLTWLLASYDAYSVMLQAQMNIMNNCGGLVANAYMKQNQRPFLPPSLSSLDVYLRVHIETPNITYSCGDKPPVSETGKSFYIDPIGKPIISTASARTGAKLTYSMTKTKLFPNNTIDFAGKMFSLLVVDPDIPAGSWAGSNERPLLHGMIIDIRGDDVTTGDEVHGYLGPRPPNNQPHIYYFLLYEQKAILNISDTSEYTPGCLERLKGRCMFNVTQFVATNNLTLVGATWLSATTDKYVECLREPVSMTTTEAITDIAHVTTTSLHHVLLVTLVALWTMSVMGESRLL